MTTEKQIVESIKEVLNKGIGEALTPASIATMKQAVNQTLMSFLAKGDFIESIPEIHMYAREDSFCEICRHQMWEHLDPCTVDVEIGYPKRPKACARCIGTYEEIEKD